MTTERSQRVIGDYLVSSSFSTAGEGYVLAFTRCIQGVPTSCKAWRQLCSGEDFQVFVTIYNPSLEGDVDTIMKKLQKIVSEDNSAISFTGTDEADERTLNVETALGQSTAFLFRWKFECQLIEGKEFIDEFVSPTLSLAATLNHQCELLESIVERKDQEIQEHKANGSVLKRTHLETRPFDKLSFRKDSMRTEAVRDVFESPALYILKSQRARETTSMIAERKSALARTARLLVSPQKAAKLNASPVQQSPTTMKKKKNELEELEQEKKRREEILAKQSKASEPASKKNKSIF